MRYFSSTLEEWAHDKMVWISGPRQVGKTTLAKAWLHNKSGEYLTWDLPSDRARVFKPDFVSSLQANALVLDEIHKYAKWKSWLKGLYDKRPPLLEIVMTGSARLNVFQRGGDSLLGRYELLRLHPFSMGELTHASLPSPPTDWLQLEQKAPRTLWSQLERRGGFPEPFAKDDDRQHQRWIHRRLDLLIHEDLRELSQIKSLSLVEHLALLLPLRVGAVLSLQSLREELQVAHDTVRLWIEALERLYFCFRIPPFHNKMQRAVKKEQKLYLWDWSNVENPGARFENMVASHLLKAIHAWTDLGYGAYDLCYFRDTEKREVDFVITHKQKPIVFLEAKQSDVTISASLVYLGKQFPHVPCIQLVNRPDVDQQKGLYRVVSAERFLGALV